MIDKKNIRYLIVWIGSLMYYNAVECFLIIDHYGHIYNYHHPIMDMKVAFITYPVISYLSCCLDRVDSKAIYYSILSVLCLVYSSIVVYFNISHFPNKTWMVLLIFFICSIATVWIEKKLNKTIPSADVKLGNRSFSVIFSLLIIIAVICTAFCHAYLI